MQKKSLKTTAFILSALIFAGCTPPTTSENHGKQPASQNGTTNVTTDAGTTVTLSAKENGVDNPVGPENLQSIVVNGVTIPAADISFGTGFSTKASGDYQVTFEGAGKYYIVNKTTGKVLENRALIVFNLLNSKTPAILPILKGILDNNIKMSIDFSTGNVYGGVLKEDGTIDDTKPVFQIGTDGNLIVTEPDGTQTTFVRNDANNTNLPDPEKTVELSAEEVKKQIGEIQQDIPANSPVADYVGLWLYEGLGQKIIMQVRDAGQNKFDASATVTDKKYTGQGNYNPNGKNDTLTLKVPDDQMHLEMKKAGANSLQLTLVSTSNQDLKTFQNAPLNLQRVRSAE